MVCLFCVAPEVLEEDGVGWEVIDVLGALGWVVSVEELVGCWVVVAAETEVCEPPPGFRQSAHLCP